MSDALLQFTPGAVKKATEGCKSADLWKVPPSRLRRVPGFNVRTLDDKYRAKVREYADSMKANGYYFDKPMAGYVAKEDGEDVIFVTDGYTRMDAIDLAASEGVVIEVVPVVTKPNGTSMEDLTVALVTGNAGRPLSTYETAVVVKRLIGYGLDEKEIAFRLTFTVTHVQNMLTFMGAPYAVRKMVEEDKVSFTAALAAYREHGGNAAQVLKESLAKAQEQGKGRLTPKMVNPSGAPRVPKVSKPILVRSVTWLKEHKLDDDSRFLDFLAFLGGLEDSAAVLKVAEKAMAKSNAAPAKVSSTNPE